MTPPCSHFLSPKSHITHTGTLLHNFLSVCVVSLSLSIKLSGLVSVSLCFHHVKPHTHTQTSERKHCVASLLRNTRLRGKRLVSGLSCGRGR